MTLEQLTAYFAAAVTICGILANVLPQQWAVTKWLTKIGALTFRAATKHPPVLGVALAILAFGAMQLTGCSLESARYRRAARSSFEENVKMAQSARPAEWCKKIDNWHVGLEIGGGVVVAPIGAAAGIVAAADTSDGIEKAAIGVGLGALAVETAILAADGKLVSVWTEQGCGQ